MNYKVRTDLMQWMDAGHISGTIIRVQYLDLYNTLLNSNRLIGCLWSRDIE